MTNAELLRLAPIFAPSERRVDGCAIQWPDADYLVFAWLRALRVFLGAPVHIIRETHLVRKSGRANPWDATAVDFTVPALPLSQVFLAMDRLAGECGPPVSFGLYAGRSAHVDRRAYDDHPARWMAVKRAHEPLLERKGLTHLVTTRSGTWTYLSWSHEDSFQALALVLELAEGHAA